MNREEFDKIIEVYFNKRKQDQGKITKVQIGQHPVNIEQTLHFGQNNKVASEDLIRHYADAIGDANPLWRDPNYARNTRYGGIIAPATFIDCIAPSWGSKEISAYLGDKFLDLPAVRALNASSKFEWFRVIHAGDEFSVVDKFVDITEKPAKKDRSYRLFLENTKRFYINQREEIVATAEARGIRIMAFEASDQAAAFKGQKEASYTDDELKRVFDHYEAQKKFRRGSEVLYWEDVNEGDDLNPLVAGPVTAYDEVAFFQAVGIAVAFDMEWANWQSIPAHYVKDPATGVFHDKAESHISERLAKLRGTPSGYGFAAQAQGLICRMISNWMGDDGFLKELDCQSRVPVYHSDTHWVKGKVEKKFVKENEHLVELEVWVEKQDGTVHMPGKALVRLCSRSDDRP